MAKGEGNKNECTVDEDVDDNDKCSLGVWQPKKKR